MHLLPRREIFNQLAHAYEGRLVRHVAQLVPLFWYARCLLTCSIDSTVDGNDRWRGVNLWNGASSPVSWYASLRARKADDVGECLRLLMRSERIVVSALTLWNLLRTREVYYELNDPWGPVREFLPQTVRGGPCGCRRRFPRNFSATSTELAFSKLPAVTASAPPNRFLRSDEVAKRLDAMYYGFPVLPVRLKHCDHVQSFLGYRAQERSINVLPPILGTTPI